jgi:hypothetical protein
MVGSETIKYTPLTWSWRASHLAFKHGRNSIVPSSNHLHPKATSAEWLLAPLARYLPLMCRLQA